MSICGSGGVAELSIASLVLLGFWVGLRSSMRLGFGRDLITGRRHEGAYVTVRIRYVYVGAVVKLALQYRIPTYLPI